MAEYKNKKSFIDEGIREYDFNKKHKRAQQSAGIEKHEKSERKPKAKHQTASVKKR